MKVPKEIMEKAKEYVDLKRKTKKLYKDIERWINDVGGTYVSDIFISDSPCGYAQSDGEHYFPYRAGESGDSFEGVYYHQSEEDSGIYLAYNYWC